jgi:NitT/TauT family transport system ATP-binding protein
MPSVGNDRRARPRHDVHDRSGLMSSPAATVSLANSDGWIVAQHVGKAFRPGHPVLRDVSLSISHGEFVAFLGPSGCGKSTMLRLIAGLLDPTDGQLLVAGVDPVTARRTAVRPAFVFQDPTLLPWRTVAQNIGLPLELKGQSAGQYAERLQSLMALVGLTADDAMKRPRMLSGGMRMRVSLARALMTDPDLLLLDEPFAALDDVLRQQLNEELVKLWQTSSRTMLFVTHNVAEAVFLSQRVLVFSPRPGSIVREVRIPFGKERTASLRATPEFARLVAELSDELRKGRS